MRLLRGLAGLFLSLLLAAGLTAKPAAAAGITATWQPLNEQLEVFWVDGSGAVRGVWKSQNKRWHQPFNLTGPGAAPPGALITSVWQVQDDQLEIFWVDSSGALNLAWKAHNSLFKYGGRMTGPGFAAPGAPLTAVWQPIRHQLHVFGIGPDGRLNFVYKDNNTKWSPAFAMTGPGFGVPGAQLTSVFQGDRNEHLEVFAVAPNGAINVKWKAFNEEWAPPASLTPPGVAPPGAALSAVWQPLDNHLEVFWIDKDGAVNTLWRAGYDPLWRVLKASGPGFAPPGAPVTSVFQPLGNHLEVFAIGADGAVNDVWKANNGKWERPFAVAPPGSAPSRGDIKAVLQPTPSQMEVFWQDTNGTVWDVWKAGNEAWKPPFRLTDVDGAALITAGMCTDFFRRWRVVPRFVMPDEDYMLGECKRLMGIDAYCDARDKYAGLDYYDNQTKQRLICVQKYHEDSIGEEALSLLKGIGEGAVDGLIAAAPYLGPAVEGVSCVSGVIYACAALALEVAKQAGAPIPGIIGEAATVAHDVLTCVDGNIAKCVSLGQRGVRAVAGDKIPGMDVARALEFADACRRGQFAGCARLGQMAAEAAGVPIVPEFKTAADALACLDSGKLGSACQELGLETAKAAAGQFGIPLGGLADGLDLADKCRRNIPGTCFQLGKLAAKAAGLPVDLALALAEQSRACADGNADACIGIGKQAAKAAGVPLDDVVLVDRCARGDNNACVNLATKTSGVPLGDVTKVADMVSRCVKGNSAACVDLGKTAVSRYGDEDAIAAMMAGASPPVVGVVTGAGPKAGSIEVARSNNTTPFLPPPALPCPAGTVMIGSACANPCPAGQEIGAAGKCAATAAGCPPGEAMINGGCLNPCPAGQRLDGARCVGAPVVAAPIPPPVAAPTPPPMPAPPVVAAPVVKVPLGACPGREAAVTQGVTVRDGSGGVAINPPLQRGQVVQCLACDASWCLIAAANPHATVSRQFLDFSFAAAKVQPAPAPPPVVAATPKVPPSVFAGTWTVVSDKSWNYRMSFSQAEAMITGTFVDQQGLTGRMKGTVNGPIFTFTWDEDGGYTGDGKFTMSPDGKLIDGSYRVDPKAGVAPDLLRGNWKGTRSATAVTLPAKPPAVQPADFSGDWTVKSDKSWTYFMKFTQTGVSIIGTFVDIQNRKGSIRGTVNGNIFAYSWDQDGGYTGDGNFTMSADRKVIAGSYRADPRPDLTANLLRGNWQGTRGIVAAPAPAPAPPPVDSNVDYGGCGGCGKKNDPIVVH